MVAYLGLFWKGDVPVAAHRVRTAFAPDGAWAVSDEGPEHMVLTRGPVRPRIRRLPSRRGLVIGDLFRAGSARAVGDEIESVIMAPRLSGAAMAAELAQTFWGRYVAVIRDHDQPGIGLFRDPSGAVELMAWLRDGVTFVGSHLPQALPADMLPEGLAVDWTQVAGFVAAGSAMGGGSGLVGLTAVTPGALLCLGQGEQQIWSPVAAASGVQRSAGDAMRALPDVVDACVMRLAGEGTITAEISGGLDSAIIASSLALHRPGQVTQWINYHSVDRPGDERAYARAVAERWALPLVEAIKPDFAITLEMLDAVADGLRPGVTAGDAVRDRDAAERIARLGVERVVTGQGGDMVFFQLATPVLAVDHLRRAGPLGLFSPYLLELSRWTRQSVWRTASQAWSKDPDWTGVRTVRKHPWLVGAEVLPPAKRAQIAALAQKLPIHIEGLRSRAGEVVHPLLAQPVVEFCLAVSATDLTLGGRDRGMARAAFSDRLPVQVRDRRSKGDLSEYYGRVVALSLDTLRPLLLDGRLVAQGLVHRERLDVMLTRDHLIWRGDYMALVNLAVIEAWVRHWEGRAAAASGVGGMVSPSQAMIRP